MPDFPDDPDDPNGDRDEPGKDTGDKPAAEAKAAEHPPAKVTKEDTPKKDDKAPHRVVEPTAIRLVSDAVLKDKEEPPQAKEPATADRPTDEESKAKEYLSHYGVPADQLKALTPEVKKALAQALDTTNRAAESARRLQQLEKGAQTRETTRAADDEFDPEDPEQVEIAAQNTARGDQECRTLVEAWRQNAEQFGVLVKRDGNGVLTGGEIYDVLREINDVEAQLDDKRRERLKLQPLEEDQKIDLGDRHERLLTKRERLQLRATVLDNKMTELADRFDQKLSGFREDIERTAKAKVQETRQAEAEETEKAEAERLFDETVSELSSGLGEQAAAELETALVNEADFLVNVQGREMSPAQLKTWMERRGREILKAFNLGSSKNDIETARQKERDAQQRAPRGRAAVAETPPREGASTSDRLRAANRRTSVLSSSIRAVPR